MSAQTVRLYKEARALWWPWIVVTAAGLLAAAGAAQSDQTLHFGFLSRIWRGAAVPVGSFLGIPLIATLAFSLDFQHRTLPMLLSQPIDRMQLWSEKMRVMVAAILPPAVIYCIAWSYYAPHFDRNNPFASAGTPSPWAVAAICVFVATAAAPFWTMVARSTMGSMVLNGMFPWALVFSFAFLDERVPAGSAVWPVARVIAAVLIVVYAVAMIMLSRRLFARYQVTGAGGGDLLVDSPLPLPRFFEEGFRCRPAGAVMNLVRKELRLLRPVWALTLFSAAVWLTIVAFGLLPVHDTARRATPTTNAQAIMIGLAGILSFVIAILAGTVTLGEERTSGAHAWHMTMPVSVRKQWIVKLFTAITASVVGGALIPLAILLVRGLVSGQVFSFVESDLLWKLPIGMAFVTLVAFWSACAISGTVRATIGIFPIFWSWALAAWFADWSAGRFGTPVADWLFSHADPFTFARAFRHFLDVLEKNGLSLFPPNPLIFGAPVLLFLLVQSYFLYRRQTSESPLPAARALLPSVALAVVCAWFAVLPLYFISSASRQADRMLTEMHQAIQARNPQLAADHPLQLSGDELAGASGVSADTRNWLHGARITLAQLTQPDTPEAPDFWTYLKSAPDAAHPGYVGTIDLQSGRECVVRYQPYPLHVNPALSYSFAMRGSLSTKCN